MYIILRINKSIWYFIREMDLCINFIFVTYSKAQLSARFTKSASTEDANWPQNQSVTQSNKWRGPCQPVLSSATSFWSQFGWHPKTKIFAACRMINAWTIKQNCVTVRSSPISCPWAWSTNVQLSLDIPKSVHQKIFKNLPTCWSFMRPVPIDQAHTTALQRNFLIKPLKLHDKPSFSSKTTDRWDDYVLHFYQR